MRAVDVWIAFSSQSLSEFKSRRSMETSSDMYSGPLDDATYKTMCLMTDIDNLQKMTRAATTGGKTYTLFSIVIRGNLSKAKEAIDSLTDKWPGHFIVLGAWRWDTGEQVSEQYPLHAQAWKFMPTRDVYAITREQPREVTKTSVVAASNADLYDPYLMYGQAPRNFT